MSSYWGIFLAIVLILIWIIAGGYITQANIKIRGFQGNDEFFKSANNYAFWAAFITWFLVALFVLLVILAIVGVVGLFSTGAGEAEAAGAESEELTTSKLYKKYQNYQGSQEDNTGISWSTIIVIFFALVLVSITGVLGALAADQLKQSHLFTDSNPDMVTAYNNCVITAIICLSVVGLLILSVIFYFFIGFFESDTNNKSSNLEKINDNDNSINTNTDKITNNTKLDVNDQKKLEEIFKKGTIISK